MQLLEDTRLLPAFKSAPAGLPGAETQLQRQLLPQDPGVENEQHSLQTQPVRHRSRAR